MNGLLSFAINWKTSAAGIAAVLTGAGSLFQLVSTGAPIATIVTSPGLASVITGIGLIFAKDGTTHSTVAQVEQASVVVPPPATTASGK